MSVWVATSAGSAHSAQTAHSELRLQLGPSARTSSAARVLRTPGGVGIVRRCARPPWPPLPQGRARRSPTASLARRAAPPPPPAPRLCVGAASDPTTLFPPRRSCLHVRRTRTFRSLHWSCRSGPRSVSPPNRGDRRCRLPLLGRNQHLRIGRSSSGPHSAPCAESPPISRRGRFGRPTAGPGDQGSARTLSDSSRRCNGPPA